MSAAPCLADMVDRPTKLYRHFDAGGRLLYVGIALSATYRLQQHMDGAQWADSIARVEIVPFPTRSAALAAERAAIAAEKPLHNKQHNHPEPPRVGPNVQALMDHLNKRPGKRRIEL